MGGLKNISMARQMLYCPRISLEFIYYLSTCIPLNTKKYYKIQNSIKIFWNSINSINGSHRYRTLKILTDLTYV